jgi:AcrR family transcriptional regulator
MEHARVLFSLPALPRVRSQETPHATGGKERLLMVIGLVQNPALGIFPQGLEYDATAPVPVLASIVDPAVVTSRVNQRARRSAILAAIRKLIADEGCDGVTVRRIAECSGHAVQTIYNLVGPRETAITEAIREYSAYVGMTFFDPSNPEAAADVIDHQLLSIERNPEFCRQVCLMYFTDSRHIFYAFRDSQIRRLDALLRRQQQIGVLRKTADLRGTATQLMVYSGALMVEWADREFSLEELRRRLYAGYATIFAGVIDTAGEPLRAALASRGAVVLN